jgi:two-component system, OmpR family, sensor kinase
LRRSGFRPSRRGVAFALLLAAVPVVAGLLFFLAYRAGWLQSTIVYMRISMDNMLLLGGLFLSLLGAVIVGTALLFRRHAQRQIEEMHWQAREERRQFLLRLDHELKNPLTTLQVELATLELETGESTGSSSFQRLKEQTGRLSNLGIQLRKLAELQIHPLEKEPVDLAELLEELTREFSSSSHAPHIELNLPQVPWPLPKVKADSDLIFLAFHNLLGNAIKFTRPSDSVQIRAFEDAREVVIEIADSGPGIPEAELPHIWEELYRGKLARGLPGSGLGLALVRAIIERHDGQISIRSRLEQGTVVSVRLPVRG